MNLIKDGCLQRIISTDITSFIKLNNHILFTVLYCFNTVQFYCHTIEGLTWFIFCISLIRLHIKEVKF